MTHDLPNCFLHSDDGGGLMERLWNIIREWDATEEDRKVFLMHREKKGDHGEANRFNGS